MSRCDHAFPALALAALLAALAGCDSGSPKAANESVTVMAAASTTDAIEEVAALFQRANAGIDVVVNAGPSNGLAQQIIAGAPGDVFLPASRQWADDIADRGLAAELVELLTNRMVLVVPKGNPAGVTAPSDLTSGRVSRLAIAGENVPAGVYAEQALKQLGLFERLRESNKLARGSSVRVTLAYVERGEAEAGIVYATDALLSQQVEVVAELDPSTHDRVIYPAVLLKTGGPRDAGRRFFEFLQTSAALEVFQRHGFSAFEPIRKPSGTGSICAGFRSKLCLSPSLGRFSDRLLVSSPRR